MKKHKTTSVIAVIACFLMLWGIGNNINADEDNGDNQVVIVEEDLSDYVYQSGAILNKDSEEEVLEITPEYLSGDKDLYDELIDDSIKEEDQKYQEIIVLENPVDKALNSLLSNIDSACKNWDGKTNEVVINVYNDYPELHGEKNTIKEAFWKFINNNGQYFYLKPTLRYSEAKVTSGGVTTTEFYRLYLVFDTSFTLTDKKNFDTKVNSIIKNVDSSWSDYDKALYLHEQVINSCHYDNDPEDLHYTAYDCLVRGSCVCQGYALTYDYLCSKAGVNSDVVVSDYIDHAWNMLTIDGKQYFVDCTWDDTTRVSIGKIVGHDNFLMSKTKCVGNGHCDYETGKIDWRIDNGSKSATSLGTDTKFDNMEWRKSNAPMAYNPDFGWGYVINSNTKISAYDFNKNKLTAIGYMTSSYSSPQIIGCDFGFVVSAKDNLQLVQSGKTEIIYNLPAADKIYRIFNLEAINGQISYALYKDTLSDINYVKTCKTVLPKKVTAVSVSSVPEELSIGEKYQLQTTISPSDAYNKTLSFSSSNPDVLKIDSKGNMEAISVGKAQISISTTDGSNLKKTFTINVYKPVTDILIDHSSLVIEYGEETDITSTVVPSDATYKDLIWSSTNSKIAKYENGKIITVGTGTCEIKVTTPEGKITKSCFVTVIKSLKALEFELDEIEISKNMPVKLNCKIYPEDTTTNIIYKSQDESIVTVDSKGVITGHKPGTTYVVVSSPDQTIKDTIKINIPWVNTTDIKLSDTNLFLANSKITDGITLVPEDSDDELVVISSNENVAYWENGKLITKGVGTSNLTISSNGIEKKFTIKTVDHLDIRDFVPSDSNTFLSWDKVCGVQKYVIYRADNSGLFKVLTTTSDNNYRDKNISSGNYYTYKINALNSDNKETINGNSLSTVSLDKPTISSFKNTGTGFEISWGKVNGAKTYYIYKKTNGGDFELLTYTKELSLIDTKVVSGEQYSYYVMAGSGNIFSNSEKVSMYYLSPSTPSANNTSDGISITWTEVKGATSYYVYRKETSGGYYKIATSLERKYLDSNVNSGTKYTYAIIPVKGTTRGSYITSKTIMRLDTVIPSVVNTEGGFNVSWGSVSGATGYELYRKVSGGNYSKIATVKTTSYIDTDISAGVTYLYALRPINGSDFGQAVGQKATRLLVCNTVSSNQNNGISVSWNKVKGATGYYLYRKTGNGNYNLIKKITDNTVISYIDEEVSGNNGTLYTYAVRAFNGTSIAALGNVGRIVRLNSTSVLSLKNSQSLRLDISWTKNTVATGYEIKLTNSNGTKTYVVDSNISTKTITNLTKNSTYTVSVRTYKITSGIKYYSSWSGAKSILVK